MDYLESAGIETPIPGRENGMCEGLESREDVAHLRSLEIPATLEQSRRGGERLEKGSKGLTLRFLSLIHYMALS